MKNGFRNFELAQAQKEDPSRYRGRIVESKKRKDRHNRRRAKEAFLNERW
jgi:hypothetical protein